MENNGNFDLSKSIKTLVAENNSQAARLEEYTNIVNSRDKEIEVLHTMLSEANEYRSTMDNQLKELKELRQDISDLQEQVSASVYSVTGRVEKRTYNTVSMEQQLQTLNQEYTFLQSQLADLQTHLLDVNNRNLLLQQQTSRISELESLLTNAEDEIVELKQKGKGYF
ncbi:MAG: hypothetical protein WKI04_05370 [Ferruginibacter sp.]